jgi:RND superfamily putative drug exporter
MLGIGIALAILVDATLIRAVPVPAFMQLAGRGNWWAPKPLRRLHERIGLSE